MLPLHKQSALKTITRTLHHKMLFIFGVTFLGFALTALYIQNLKPLYTATVKVVFDHQDPAFIKTQETHLKSSNIIMPVIEKFGLTSRPFYAKTKIPLDTSSSFKSIKPYAAENSPTRNNEEERKHDEAMQLFLKQLDTAIVPGSYVLNLSYTHYNPRLAAKIINEIADTYIENLPSNTPETRIDPQARMQLDYMRQDIDRAHEELENFRSFQMRSKPPLLIKTKTTTLYEKARLEFVRAKANYEAFKDPSGVMIMNDRAPAILNAQLVQKLKFQQKSVEEQLKTLSERYGPKHPEIIALTAEFNLLHDEIKKAKQAVMAQTRAEYEQARAKMQSLENIGQPIEPKPSAATSNIAQQKLDFLEKELQASIDKYKAYQAEIEEQQKQKAVATKTAKILERAHAPLLPSHPKKGNMLARGTILSFIAAMLLAFLFEKSRNGFLSGRQLEEELCIPCYALIPRTEKLKTNAQIGSYVLDNPSSQIAEAVRSLRLTLRLREDQAQDIENKVITITSSFPNEGKTTLSAWLGRLAAKSGERVILIDADLRRPSLHKMFDQPNTISLVEYLTGKDKLEDVINTKDPTGLHVIYGRSVPNSALDLISSDKMDELIRSLRKAYDLIIIDSPASLAVADARALNKFSDYLLYVVSWNKTAREIVHNGTAQFMKFGKPRIATVLTNINVKKHVQFGYGDAVNYIGNYKEYYNA